MEKRIDINQLKESKNNVVKGKRNLNERKKPVGKKQPQNMANSTTKENVDNVHNQKKTRWLDNSKQKGTKSKKSYDCPRCEKKFDRSSNLQQHVSAVHEQNKPFKCEICDASYKAKAVLKIHYSSVHETPMPFTCKKCKQGFTRKDRRQKHEEKCSE